MKIIRLNRFVLLGMSLFGQSMLAQPLDGPRTISVALFVRPHSVTISTSDFYGLQRMTGQFEFSHSGSFILLQSTRTLPSFPDSTSVRTSSGTTIRVIKEVFIGSVTGVFFSFCGGLIGGRIDAATSHDGMFSGLGGFMIGASVGYVVGIPLGVRLVVSGEGKSVSFVGTLASSVAGAGVGIGILEAFHPKGVAGASLLALPLVCSILYVELVD